MLNNQPQALVKSDIQIKNDVLKNTYLLLSLSLLFSSATAYLAVTLNARHPGLIMLLVVTYGLMFLIHALKNSALGIAAVFLFTGFMGYALGPLLNYVLHLNNGGNIVIMSLFSTGVIFLGLSGHVLMSKKDYSYLGGMLFIGIATAILASFVGILFGLPLAHLASSALFILISSGMILFETSQIIHGGERNYILATVSLYVSLYNLFVSLLHIFSAFGGSRD
jgi:modulator of FtsH protease